MAIRYTSLGGTNYNNESITDSDLNDTNNAIIERLPPIGGIIAWAKTFYSKDSGTTDGTTASKLVQSGQNFTSTVSVGNVVHNTTDDTFAYVSAVDSDTTLSLTADIMVSGEAYTIYATPSIPSGWVECDGSVISDADSLFNGATLPDLNNNGRFLRGDISSGGTGGTDGTHSHKWLNTSVTTNNTFDIFGNGKSALTGDEGGAFSSGTNWLSSGDTSEGWSYTEKIDARPAFYNIVWIMRVK